MKKLLGAAGFVILVSGLLAWHYWPRTAPVTRSVAVVSPSPSATPTSTPLPASTVTSTPTATPTLQPAMIAPIADFKARITKKTFGLYVTPSNSPVHPERFTGYHTGVDVEYSDVTADVPVYAAANGTVVEAQWVSGYGGFLAEKSTVNGRQLFIVYGHLRASSLVKAGTEVQQGQPLGVLGTAYSQETDGERRHLHFGIYLGNSLSVKGYVSNKADLVNWENPLDFYP